MSLPPEIVSRDPDWLEEASPCNNVVVMSRARFARNLDGMMFSPHAPTGILAQVRQSVMEALENAEFFDNFYRLDLSGVSPVERAFLKESRLISKEMERGGANRSVYIARDLRSSIMVNEEDHLRLQCLECGLQINKAQERLGEVESRAAERLQYAYHERFGYLTACPSNVGTGLRVSVMMHLPALTLRKGLERALEPLPNRGLTVRGFYGENSENTGDFFQVSNEVTLGKSAEEIEETLAESVGAIMEMELEARSTLLRTGGMAVQDSIWRAYGVLTHARRIDSIEAMRFLSRVRLGIDESFFPGLTHELLNRLIVEIQPGHLIMRHGATDDPEERDVARARLLRENLQQP